MSKYFVYMHVVPNGKVYIGITSETDPNKRWRYDGSGYKNNQHFWNAIQKYGWNNIMHKVLFSGLCAEIAKDTEKKLIAHYKSNITEFGYNHTIGGDNISSGFSADVLEKLSISMKERWKNPAFREHMMSCLNGHIVSETTRNKISRSKTGKKLGTSRLNGRHISEEHRLKLCGKAPWNKGLNKYNNSILKSVSDNAVGRIFSDEAKQKMSNSHKDLYKNGYRPLWMHNGDSETLVDHSNVPFYESIGYSVGRLNVKNIYINNGSISIKINDSELAEYLRNGWTVGRLNSTYDKIAKRHQKYDYYYNDIHFTSVVKMMRYLKLHGYPTISTTSLNKIINGDNCSVYPELYGVVRKEDVNQVYENQKN